MAVAVGLFFGGWAVAAQSIRALTMITAPDMDCASCAMKVGGEAAVPGVAKVGYNVPARAVTPKAGEAPSPKTFWEAVVAAGQNRSKLEGPGGVFTAKPKK